MYGMVLERLEAWVQNPANQPRNSVQSRKRIPTSILFYRDGLSESQFQECNDTEIQAVQQAFATLATKYNQPNAQLNLTFIVVGKRHHTRFFPKTESESHGPWNQPAKLNGNVKPGLLVNSVITTPNDFNFYLQSHAAPNGTARPAHYHILRDGMNFGSTNTRLAELTNILCYCFPRALKGVSYAAPAYIADRLCERGRMYLKNWAQPYNYRLPADDNEAAWTETRIKAWKTRKALELSQSADWGHYQHADSANREKRHNPWSKTLDGTMFWM
jgi:eukaryotic translation initiation factor 2C